MATRIPEEMRCIMGEIFQLLCVFLSRTCDADRHCLLRHKHSVPFSAQTRTPPHTHTPINTYKPPPPLPHTQILSLSVSLFMLSSIVPLQNNIKTLHNTANGSPHVCIYISIYMCVCVCKRTTNRAVYIHTQGQKTKRSKQNETPKVPNRLLLSPTYPVARKKHCQGSEYNCLR